MEQKQIESLMSILTNLKKASIAINKNAKYLDNYQDDLAILFSNWGLLSLTLPNSEKSNKIITNVITNLKTKNKELNKNLIIANKTIKDG